MRNFIRFGFMLWVLFIAPTAAHGQGGPINTVTNIAALLSRAPSLNNPYVDVLGYRTAGDWGDRRSFYATTNISSISTNRGHVFQSSKPNIYYVSLDGDAASQDIRWFGVDMSGTLAAGDALEAAYNYCLSKRTTNGFYVSIPSLEAPAGVAWIDRPLNFTSPGESGGFPQNYNIGWAFKGQGSYLTQFRFSFTDSNDTNYAGFDLTRWIGAEVSGMSLTSAGHVPKTALLLARPGYGREGSGRCKFYDLHVVGRWGLANVITIESEINEWSQCAFQQFDANNQNIFLSIGYFLGEQPNDPPRIQSKFITLTDSWGSGNGLNHFLNCRFASSSDNHLPVVRLEFTQNWKFDQCYFYGTNNQDMVVIDERTEGPTFDNCRQEQYYLILDGSTSRFLTVESQSVTNIGLFDTNGIWRSGQGPVYGLTVRQSSVGEVWATNISKLYGFVYEANRPYMSAQVGTNVYSLLSAYDMYGASFRYSGTATNYAEPYAPGSLTATIRNESKDNTFNIATNANLTVFKGHESDQEVLSSSQAIPARWEGEMGGLDFSQATNDVSHAAAALLSANQPGLKSFTLQIVATMPTNVSDGFTKGLVSFAIQTNGALISTGGVFVSQYGYDLRFDAFGSDVADFSRWTAPNLIADYMAKRLVITMVRDAGVDGLRVYANGFPLEVTNSIGGLGASWAQDFEGSQFVNIGGVQESAVDNVWDGVVHRVTYWTNALTASEALNSVMYGLSLQIPVPVLDLDFSADTGGDPVFDRSGNGQSATIYGNPGFTSRYAAGGGHFVLRSGDTMTGALVISNYLAPYLLKLTRTNGVESVFSQFAGYLSLITTGGALSIFNSETNETLKTGRIQFGNYSNLVGRPIGGILGQSDIAANGLSIGGGVSSVDAVQTISFFTAPSVGMDTGTEVFQVNPNGISTMAQTNILSYVAGWTTNPDGTLSPIVAEARGNFTGGSGTNAAVRVDGVNVSDPNFRTTQGLTNIVSGSDIILHQVLQAGSNITLGTNGNAITIASSGGGGTNGTTVTVNSTNVSPLTLNLTNSSEIGWTLVGSNASPVLLPTGVTPGTYTPAAIIVDNDGRITSAGTATSAAILGTIVTGVGVTNDPAGVLRSNFSAGTNILIETGVNGLQTINVISNWAFTYTTNTIISVSPTLTTNSVSLEFPYATAAFTPSNNNSPSDFEVQGLDTAYSSNVTAVYRLGASTYFVKLSANQPTNYYKRVSLFKQQDTGETISMPLNLSTYADSGGTNYVSGGTTNLIRGQTGTTTYQDGEKVMFRLYSSDYLTNIVISSTTLVTNTIVTMAATLITPPAPPAPASPIFVEGVAITNANFAANFAKQWGTTATTNVFGNPQEIQATSTTNWTPSFVEGYSYENVLTGNTTLNFPTGVTTNLIGQRFTFVAIQGGSGNNILTLATNYINGDQITIDPVTQVVGIKTNLGYRTYISGYVKCPQVIELLGISRGFAP